MAAVAGTNPPFDSPALKSHAAGLDFQNPILLAAGTAAYGRELSDVMVLDHLGGLVTKAVSLEPRAGAPSPRVAEFDGGMINAVGLANPGVDEVMATELPWLAREVKTCARDRECDRPGDRGLWRRGRASG